MASYGYEHEGRAVTLLWVTAYWLGYGLIFTGVGMFVRALGVGRKATLRDLFGCFWIGIAAAATIVQLWHFFVPVTRWTVGLVGVLSVLGYVSLDFKSLGGIRQLGWVQAILVLFVACWVANRALGLADLGDALGYHLNSVRWTEDHPLTRGLGNLHYRLAFNSLLYAYFAIFDVWEGLGNCSHVAVSLLIVVLLCKQVLSLVTALRSERLDGRDVLMAAALPMTLYLCFSKDASNISTDAPVYAFNLVLILTLFNLLSETGANISRRRFNALTAVVLSAFLLGMKLSMAAMSGVVLLGLFAAAWRGRKTFAAWVDLRLTGVAALIVMVLVGTWLTRSVVLSGHLLFPVSATAVDVPWRVPAGLVASVKEETQDYPRLFLPNKFVGPLLKRVPLRPVQRLGEIACSASLSDGLGRTLTVQAVVMATFGFVWVVLPAVTLIVWLTIGIARVRKRTLEIKVPVLLIMMPLLFSVGFWATTAPDPRFVYASTWPLAALVTAVALRGATDRRLRAVFVAVLLFGAVASAAFRVLYLRGNRNYAAIRTSEVFWNTLPMYRDLPRIPPDQPTTFTTDSGLKVYVPDRQTSTSPIPSMPYPDPGLAELTRGDPFSGYYFAREPRKPGSVDVRERE